MPLRLALALALALLLMPAGRGVAATRAVTYMPSVVPDVAYALLWLWLLNPVYGPVALLLQSLGLPSHEWLLSPAGRPVACVLLGVRAAAHEPASKMRQEQGPVIA